MMWRTMRRERQLNAHESVRVIFPRRAYHHGREDYALLGLSLAAE